MVVTPLLDDSWIGVFRVLTQAVSGSPHGVQLLEVERTVDLAAQIQHILVDEVGSTVIVVGPDMSEDLGSAEYHTPGLLRNNGSLANSLLESSSSASPRQSRRDAGSNLRSPNILLTRQGTVVSKPELQRLAWSGEVAVSGNVVQMYIGYEPVART